MIGLMILLLGIVSTVSPYTIFVLSGIPYWGSLIYIISGSLCIAAEYKLHGKGSSSLCLANGSLGMNITSALITGISIIILLLDLLVIHFECIDEECNDVKDAEINPLSRGIICVNLVFTILEFIISIFLGCKSNACCSQQVLNVHQVVIPQSYALKTNPSHDLNISEVASDLFMNHIPADVPPQYNESSAPKYES